MTYMTYMARSAMSRLAGVSAVIASGACYPMLAHPTHVEQGATIAVNAGVQTGSAVPSLESRSRVPTALAGTAVFAAGFRGEAGDGPAARLAGGLNVMALAFVFDAYLEAPADFLGDFDAGAGIGEQMVFLPAVIPYVQVGRRYENGRHWFVSNGVGFVRHFPLAGHSTLWLPTVAFGGHGAQRSWFAFVTGVVGNRPPDCGKPPCLILTPAQRTFLMVGVNLERQVHTPWFRNPPTVPTRRPPPRLLPAVP